MYGFGGFLPDILPQEFAAPPSPGEAAFAGSDEDWMREALRASMEGCGKASPNPSVGCVVVKDGREVARGCTSWFGGPHGERNAIARVPADFAWAEATVYVVLEPCAHHGKQPPCADLFAERKPGRVVCALGDPFAQVDGAGFAKLAAAGIPVTRGVLAREAALWLSAFLLGVKRKGAVVAAKWAQSLDGCLADDQGDWRWITGAPARAYTHWLRLKYDGILVGAGTLLNDAPRLDARDRPAGFEEAPGPLRIVFDPHARLLSAAEGQRNALRSSTLGEGVPLVVIGKAQALEAGRKAEPGWRAECESRGVRFVPFEGEDLVEGLLGVLDTYDFSEFRPSPFRARPLGSVLVEGGPTLLNALFDAGRIDIAHAFLAPFFLGGVRNRIGTPHTLARAERLASVASFRAGNDAVWELLPPRTHAMLAACLGGDGITV